MPRYALSPAAKTSLINIKAWSTKQFGVKPITDYLKRIRQKMRDLAEQPSLGRNRQDIKQGYYSAIVGSHTIYYQKASFGIEVIDVLHQSMEPELHL